MDELKRCPKCGCYMTMRINYNNAIPIVWHECENCEYDNRNMWSNIITTTSTNYNE